jgi:hypothetical protein
MTTYKIKSIFKNSLLVQYRKDNGDLVEFECAVEKDWDKKRIEEEISKEKLLRDNQDCDLNLAQYFSKNEELEFIDLPDEDEIISILEKEAEEKQILLKEKEDKEFLDYIIQYRNTAANYRDLRWEEYPSIESQLDALYWMRQGVVEPIQEIDNQIKAAKEKYPKNQETNLTLGDLDDMFPSRPSQYKDDLRSRDIQADFL